MWDKPHTHVNDGAMARNVLLLWSIYALCMEMAGSLHTEAEAKLPFFHRRYFQMHFLERKCMDFAYNFNEICS